MKQDSFPSDITSEIVRWIKQESKAFVGGKPLENENATLQNPFVIERKDLISVSKG